MTKGPWTNDENREKTSSAGGDSEDNKESKKESKDDKKEKPKSKDGDGDEDKKESTGIPELDAGIEIKADSGKKSEKKMIK